MKTLYFEGAGWSSADISKKTVGNCRIRTAFRLDDGRAVYLEMHGAEADRRMYKNENVYKWPYTGFVMSCHYITDEEPNNDENTHQIHPDAYTFEYSEAGILGVVNSLGASFDAVKVLPDLGGYRVFPEKKTCKGMGGYNFGDDFGYDSELISRREAVHNRVYEIEKAEMEQDLKEKGSRFSRSSSSAVYPTFSLWVDEKDPGLLHLLRHFIGMNKHWTIRVDTGDTLDDWMATMTETRLGECAC